MIVLTSISILLADSAFYFFFFNDTATTEIYTLSLHDALPISTLAEEDAKRPNREHESLVGERTRLVNRIKSGLVRLGIRSEEHTSELQSRQYLVCRLLLEKKKTQVSTRFTPLTSMPSFSYLQL